MAMSFEEYVNAYYGGQLGISKRYGIKKADDPLATTDTGYFNAMYGAAVFNQLNTKSEIFKLLPKEGWTQSGWRVLTARGTTTAGRAEGATLGTTDVPDITEVTATIKEVVTPWDVTTRAEFLAEADDGVKGLAAFLRREQAEAHSYYIDAMLCADGNTVTAANFESLDRIAINATAAPAVGWGANDDDIYDIDRDTGSWHAATVSHNSETDKALTLAMMDTLIQGALENGANYDDLIWLTGHDSLQDIKALINTSSNATWRFDLGPMGQGSMNGVSAERGMNLDSRVGYYDSIPIFVSQHIVKDGASHVYLLDMAHLKMKIAAPTTYVASEDLAVTQKLAKDFAYITAGEIICTKFITQGSIRDLS